MRDEEMNEQLEQQGAARQENKWLPWIIGLLLLSAGVLGGTWVLDQAKETLGLLIPCAILTISGVVTLWKAFKKAAREEAEFMNSIR